MITYIAVLEHLGVFFHKNNLTSAPLCDKLHRNSGAFWGIFVQICLNGGRPSLHAHRFAARIASLRCTKAEKVATGEPCVTLAHGGRGAVYMGNLRLVKGTCL